MERQSPKGRGHNRRQPRTIAALARTGVTIAILGLGAAAGTSQAVAQTTTAEVGYVVTVSGRVVMLSGATPVLLDPLDAIRDRARLDLQAGSEMRICHYATQRLLTLKGPLRASVSADGLRGENGRPLDVPAVPCATPQESKRQGGLVARGVILTGGR